MINSATTRKPGEPPAHPLVAPTQAQFEKQISASAATTSGSGLAEPVTSKVSGRSNVKRAKVSPDHQGKRATARAKTTIAISAETISAQLDKLESPERMMALVELIRRFTRRLETEGVIIIDQLNASIRELT